MGNSKRIILANLSVVVFRCVCVQRQTRGTAVAAEGGQGRGEARHLGLSCRLHLQTGPEDTR